jgi:hypothetical protein
MVSTVDDLYKWTKALHSNKIFTAATTQKMITPYMNHYGYGIGIDSLKTHLRISHNGGIPGFVSHLAYYPADDVCVVAISNNGGNSDKLGISLASILFDLPVQKPYIPKEVTIDTLLLEKYVGKYIATNPIELVKKNGKLYHHRENGEDFELKPESATRFFYANEWDLFFEFDIDKAGKVIRSWIIANGEKMEMKRQ